MYSCRHELDDHTTKERSGLRHWSSAQHLCVHYRQAPSIVFCSKRTLRTIDGGNTDDIAVTQKRYTSIKVLNHAIRMQGVRCSLGSVDAKELDMLGENR